MSNTSSGKNKGKGFRLIETTWTSFVKYFFCMVIIISLYSERMEEYSTFFIAYKNVPHQAHVEIGGMLEAFLKRALKCKLDTGYNN